MALAINRENYVLHRVHSITGLVPTGYYMAQHLALNTFSLGGPAYFNGVIEFFEGMPKHFLLAMEVFAIWLPLLFHAVYGLFIASRAENNYFATKYKWSENRMFFLQRASGMVIFVFLAYHVATTTGAKYLGAGGDSIKYDAMQSRFQNPIVLLVYAIGILTTSYHLGYGIWNFCIRWGITVSDAAQARIQKIAGFVAVALTLLGWAALIGFLIHKPLKSAPEASVSISAPQGESVGLVREK